MFLTNQSRAFSLLVCFVLLGWDPNWAFGRDARFRSNQRAVPGGKDFGNVIEHVNSDGSKTPHIVLNNKRTMPLVGFGTFQLGSNKGANRQTIKQAIKAGYRLIDTAYIYKTEPEIGEVLKEEFASGRLKREDIFITTKVWPTYFSKPRVIQSIKESLQKLKLGYVDLVLLHFPTGFKEGESDFPHFRNGTVIPRTWRPDAYLETWEAMEKAVKLGLARSIGVSNFNRNQMWKLMRHAKIRPAVNQVESHPFLNQEALRKYMMENRVIMQAYAPLRVADPDLLSSPILQGIGKPFNKTAAQVALRWQLDRSVPVVVKSSNPTRIASNIDLLDFAVTPKASAKILKIKQKPRTYGMPGAQRHPDYPFHEEK